MPTNRRDFLMRAAGLAAGINPLLGTATQDRIPRNRTLLDLFGLRYPIANAGMGTYATPELAIAVSEAGGLGAIGTGHRPVAETVRANVAQARAGTRRPFAVNFLLANEPVTLPLALEAGAPVVQFAWGIPSRALVAAVRSAGAKLGVQVSCLEGAREALDLGADYLICQGTEAGGHVQALRALYDALPQVLEAAGKVPVLAAGGMGNGAAIRKALLSGAAGVLLGTRFVATREADGHPEYKAALVRANREDSVLTICFQDGWNAPHGVLRNETVARWEAAGCPEPGKRPGEGDIISTNRLTGAAKRRYSVSGPRRDDTGRVLELALWAGKGVGEIRDLPPAGELVARLWKECLEAR